MTQENSMTFEGAYSRLEEILEKMNSGKLSLEESLHFYEEADRLILLCNAKLNYAEKKIETLIKNREAEVCISDTAEPMLQEFSPSNYAALKNKEHGA
jgi:exodeoxyribonuclease VII small subunit